METIMKMDEKIWVAHQIIYNYLWDRWGVLLGNYRASFIGLVQTFLFFIFYLGDSRSTSETVVQIISICVFSYIMFLRGHFKENNQQKAGLYNAINAEALKNQTWFSVKFRLLCIVIIGGIVTLTNENIKNYYVFLVTLNWISGFLILNWVFTHPVMIRERDNSRFKVKNTNFAYNP
jgi:hypothetical protein